LSTGKRIAPPNIVKTTVKVAGTFHLIAAPAVPRVGG
jgi:hypothetical protein